MIRTFDPDEYEEWLAWFKAKGSYRLKLNFKSIPQQPAPNPVVRLPISASPNWRTMKPKCRAVTGRGWSYCGNDAVSGSDFCKKHTKLATENGILDCEHPYSEPGRSILERRFPR